MAPKLVSPCIGAHIRAASEGDVAENNCHPFHHGDLLMMHNGGIHDFSRIKRALVDKLSDAHYLWIKGQTDSEHLFALFLDHYQYAGGQGADAMAAALQTMFRDLAALKTAHGLTHASALNLVVTNGVEMVASRYVDDPRGTPLSLHHTEGSHYVCDEQGCSMRAAGAQPQASRADRIRAADPGTRTLENRAGESFRAGRQPQSGFFSGS